MNYIKHCQKRFSPLALLIYLAILLSAVPIFAATGFELMEPGQPEYMQGDIAYIYGTGFEPNHQVVVQVIRVDNSIVTGNGTETPGSDIITTDPYGAFIYPYLLEGGTTAQYYGTLTVNAIDTTDMITVLTTTTFLDNPKVGLQGCSRERGYCNDSATPLNGWANGTNPMNGWTSGEVKGWYELEDVPYRLRFNPRESEDAGDHYLTTEHDNLRSGVTGVDSASGFYIGAGPDTSYTEGVLTKACVFQAVRLTGDIPTALNPCIVTGPTYSGADDDGDTYIDEDQADGIDNDSDGKIDEDPPPVGSTPDTRIQYTWAVYFDATETGYNKKWALYWKAHLATGSSGWPGASLHAKTSMGGSQDVPIKNVLAVQQADLSITKSDSPDPATVGGTLTYTITVTNNGPGTAKNVTVTDTLPGSVTLISAIPSTGSCSGTSTVTCSLGNISNGDSVTIAIDVTPNSAGTIYNSASVSGTTSDPDNSNNTTPSISTTVNAPVSNADLSITKSADFDPVTVGGTLTYTLTVTNNSTTVDATNVTVTDTLPAGVTNVNASGSGWACIISGYSVTCTRPTLIKNTSSVITITVTVQDEGCSLTNTASVTADQNDPDNSNNTDTITTQVQPSANLSIIKTDVPDTSVYAGAILTYTITVTNSGPSTATNVTVTDPLPAGSIFTAVSGSGWTCSQSAGTVTCNRSSLTVTTAPAITITIKAPSDPGTITNTATVSSNVNDPNSGNNSATASTIVNASANLSITKSDSPDPVTAGENLTYTITVTNNGPSTATGVTVTDTLPSILSLVSATASQGTCSGTTTITCSLGTLTNTSQATVTIVTTPTTTSPGTVGNSASVSSSTHDPISSNNTSTMIMTTVNTKADLSISKSGTPNPVAMGGTLTYTINVSNLGPSTASSLVMTDNLPSGIGFVSASGTGWTCGFSLGVVLCTMPTLAVGSASPISIVVTAPNITGTINNIAGISSDTTDPVSGNNSTGQIPTTVIELADLSIAKTATPNPAVPAGGTLTYTISVNNLGPNAASTVTVTDTLPGGVNFVSVNGSGWTCGHSGGIVTCTIASLAVGAAPDITIVVTAPGTYGTIYNTASITTTSTDPVSGNNNTGSVPTSVTPSSDLSISKSAALTVSAGGSLIYTVSVSNIGPSTASGVIVTDTLPLGVGFVSANGGTDWSCNNSAGVVTCNSTVSIPVGPASDIYITITAPNEGGNITNNAGVTGNEFDPVGGNDNTLPVVTNVIASSDLSITKTDSPDPITVGQNLTYIINVSNNGPSTATGVTVTDTLPGTVTYVSATPSQGSCTGSVTVNCTLGNMINGASATVTIVVTTTEAGTIYNTASVAGSETDPNTGNNTTLSVPTTVNPEADLSITNIAPALVAIVGDNVTYTITVTNNGPSPVTGVVVEATLDSVTYGSATPSQGTCTVTTIVTCTIGTLANGGFATITIVAGTNSPASMIGNTASVTANESDPNLGNNSSLAATNVGDISRLVGISTRGKVETGQYVMVGGFSFGGILPKQILVRGRGPSMSGPPYNFTGTLTNTILEIYSGPTLFAVVDNWQDGPTQCDAPALSCGTPATMQAISVDPCQPNVGQTTAPPGCTQEAALLITLPPGAYTAKLKGVNGEMGKGIIEVYDPDTSTMPKVEGISTRGKVLTGTDIMVGGFLIGAGSGSKTVLIRGRGPSMSGAPYNFTGTLANPTLEVFSGQTMFATIDDWQTGPLTCAAPAISCGTPVQLETALMDPCQPNVGQTVAPPGCSMESAIIITLPPGAYTAKLKGVDSGTGIGIVEIYEMP